jgi:hypothetical protein
MGTQLTTVRPKDGYEYKRIRSLPEGEWRKIREEFFKIFSFWGYNSVSYLCYPSPGKSLAFYLRRFYEGGDEGRKIPDNIKPGTLMGSISIDFVYLHPIPVSLERLIPIVPSTICLEPQPSWEGYLQCDRTMIAVETIHREGILADDFKIVYCCLPETIGFTTGVDLPNYCM